MPDCEDEVIVLHSCTELVTTWFGTGQSHGAPSRFSVGSNRAAVAVVPFEELACRVEQLIGHGWIMHNEQAPTLVEMKHRVCWTPHC
jgi:hypothetical protein